LTAAFSGGYNQRSVRWWS